NPYRIAAEAIKHIPRDFHEEIGKSRLRAGDVVVARTGRPGTAAVIPDWLPDANCSDLVVIRTGPNVDARYLTYFLNSQHGQDLIRARHVGSVQVHFNIGAAKSLPFLLRPLDEQRRIAAVLGALDDKIELNRKMNATLEEMAQVLFKSWFIDFDGHDDLVESELGMIPRGWEAGVISDLIDIVGGGTPKKSEGRYWGEGIPWFSVKDAPPPSDLFVVDTELQITDAGLSESSARLVPPRTTIISARGTVGKLALTAVPMAFNQSCYGIRPSEDYGELFVHFSIREVVEQLRQAAHGSVFDTITRKTFDISRLVIPPVEAANRFEAIAGPLADKILLNVRESRTLAELRDTLLPKLISGEIRVPEAEEEVEAMV
ncbi:MAG: restriction endonuclease subunit S, partial [Rhodospirillaceae bacterium]